MPPQVSRHQDEDAKHLFQQWGGLNKTWFSLDRLRITGDETLESSVLVTGLEAEAIVWPTLVEWLRGLNLKVESRAQEARREQVVKV